MSVHIGISKIDYHLCRGVELRMPSNNERYGFLRIYKAVESAGKPRSVLFFFENGSGSKRSVQEMASYINDKLDETLAHRENKAKTSKEGIEVTGDSSRAPSGCSTSEPVVVPESSIFDELVQWKKLLDDDVITADEYAAKKSQLLGLTDGRKPRRFCSECGAKLPDDAQFCPECGAAVL